MADEKPTKKFPPPRFTYTARKAMTLTHVEAQLVPVVPPVELREGQSVELWWVIEDGELHYEHAGSKRGRLARDHGIRREEREGGDRNAHGAESQHQSRLHHS